MLYLVQNLLPKNKESRTISLNSQYMVVFKNPRDASQMSHLARQLHPVNEVPSCDRENSDCVSEALILRCRVHCISASRPCTNID